MRILLGLLRHMVMGAVLLGSLATADAQMLWQPRGVGGGGALFNPAISPHDQTLFVACDMSQLFRSTDLGHNWETVKATQTRAFVQAVVRFTSDPNVMYGLMYDYLTDHGVPGRSTDGGETWTWASAAAWPDTQHAQRLYADPNSTHRVLVADENRVYFSADDGASFRPVYDPAGYLFTGGAFFDGNTAYVATESGLMTLDMNNPNAMLVPFATSGFPAAHWIAELAGAREGTTLRFFAIASNEALRLDLDYYGGDAYFYEDRMSSHSHGIYRLDIVDGAGSMPAWVQRDTGFFNPPLNQAGTCPNTGSGGRDDRAVHIAMAANDIDVAFVGANIAPCLGENVRVYRTLDGGDNWVPALVTTSAQNAVTGWMGFSGGDRGLTYDAPLRGISVKANDANVVAFTGNGFIHVTENGANPAGLVWRQAYTAPVNPNTPGTPTLARQYYASAGLENTSVWDLAWASHTDPNPMFAAFTDIQGIRSQNAGATWSFDYQFQTPRNSMYRVTRHADGSLYAAVSGVHDLYQSHRSRDQYADDSDNSHSGLLIRSTNQGANWTVIHDFVTAVAPHHQVVWVELDPSNPERAFVSVLSSVDGGVYMTENLSAGTGSTWTPLGRHARAQGRPSTIRLLNDGGLVVSESVRRLNDGSYHQSAGVYYKPSLAAPWEDRSDPGMQFWTKDVVIDPHDAGQNTWYAAVYDSTPLPDSGGIYRTTNRGVTWERIFDNYRAESITVDPQRPDLAWVTTAYDGLWRSDNIRAASPVFTRDAEYPFGHPLRVVYNPHDLDEVWVLSFGNGMRVSRIDTPLELIFRNGFEN